MSRCDLPHKLVTMMKILASLLLTLTVLTCSYAQENDVCRCRLDVPPEIEEGCRVYSESLTPFYRANETCLAAYNVSADRVVDYDELLEMCPYRNGTDTDLTVLVNFLRKDNLFANAIKKEFPEFFTLGNGTNASYVLQDEVLTRTGGSVQCTPSDRFCWEVIANYFGSEQVGIEDRDYVCRIVHNYFLVAVREEQSNIRSLLCGLPEVDPVCEPLASQVKSTSNCASVVVGTAGDTAADIPEECEGIVPLDVPPGGSSAGRAVWSVVSVLAGCVVSSLSSLFLV